MRGTTTSEAGATSVPDAGRDAGRDGVPSTPVSPLLNHLLECREDSERERSGDDGGVPVPSADSILAAEAIRARLEGEVATAEDWYQEAGILSRWDETNIKMHEAQPHAELAYHNGRQRGRVINRLARAEMLEDVDDST